MVKVQGIDKTFVSVSAFIPCLIQKKAVTADKTTAVTAFSIGQEDMCSSVTLRAQYDRMIAEQKQRIEELRTQYYEPTLKRSIF